MNDINENQRSLDEIQESVITFAEQSLISKIEDSPNKSLIEESKTISMPNQDDHLDK